MRFVIIVIAALGLSGCFGSLTVTYPATQDPAPMAFSDAAKAGEVPAGKARVYMVLGKWHYPDSQFGNDVENDTPSDLFVNSLDVGGINPGECLVVDLPPGKYLLYWRERSHFPYVTDTLEKTLAAGEKLFLTVESVKHPRATPPNNVGGYLGEPKDGLMLIKDTTIMLPDANTVGRMGVGIH